MVLHPFTSGKSTMERKERRMKVRRYGNSFSFSEGKPAVYLRLEDSG